MKFIAVGAQRTGTNFITQLLKEGSQEIDVLETGDRSYFWKHSMPSESGPNYSRRFLTPKAALQESPYLNVLLVSKHPLWWLSSIMNRDCADLPRQRPSIFTNDVLDVAKALKFYSDFYDAWLKVLDPSKSIHLSYHSVMQNQKAELGRVGRHFDILVDPHVDPSVIKVPYSKGTYNDRLKTYSSQSFGIDKELVELAVNSLTDDQSRLFSRLGYEL